MRAIHRIPPAHERLFHRSGNRGGCPSIGSAGLMLDRVSNRVKGIIPQLITRTNQLIDVLDSAGSMASSGGASRSTVRVFLPSFHSLGRSREGRALASFLHEFGTSGPEEGTIKNFEGLVPFTSGGSDFMLIYLGMNSPSRMSRGSIISQEKEEAARASENISLRPFDSRYSIRLARKDDVSQLVEIYNSIFTTYLTDLDEKAISSMVETTPTLVSTHGGRIVAALAAEHAGLSVEGIGRLDMVEISEAATSPAHRGNHLYSHMIEMFLSTSERDLGPDSTIRYAETRASHPAAARGAVIAGGRVCGFLNKHCVINAVRDVEELGDHENLNVVHFQGA
ncbi:MAG: GNAT family N-acetyltransferase [Candidatus Micrarchaeia archaeon]